MVKIRKQLIPSMQMANGTANECEWLTIHETANTSVGANAAAHANLQAGFWPHASWHWSVDAIEAVQSYLHNRQLRHAGDGAWGTGNAHSIAIEICVNSDMSRAAARENAAQLAAKILREEGIPISRMVQHNKWSSEDKNCPTFMRANGSKLWREFVARVRALLGSPDAPAPDPKPKPPATGKKSISQLATEVLDGKWGNDPRRSQQLRAAGYDAAAVQAEVNRRLGLGGSKPTPKPAGKTISQLADEVMAGKHGNGDARKKSLGSNYNAVQAEVNRRLSGGGSGGGKSVSQLATEVLRGDWGNDPDRKRRLEAAGYNYHAVQAEVNRRI
ncbi:N-acetylmuramoyl-L-alanine amidase [Agrococcus casei]|uniref:N-acetylmuramoyl-L-alanine amidase n=1 Tax=Agrococcus casei TaxID=343512 RepID=UPI003F9228FC